MRCVVYSNAPWAQTGYGTQVRLLVPRLVSDGHQVAIANNWGLEAGVIEWMPGVPILPKGSDIYSADILPAHYHAWCRREGGWLITLYDVWPLKTEAIEGIIPNILSWVPVDHQPVPPETLGWFTKTGALPLAMSEFGQRELTASGLDGVRYIPHAIDTNVFRPGVTTLEDGRTPREAWGFPEDAFVVVINAANKGQWPPRKAWHENLMALSMVMAAHDDVYAYVHTESAGIAQGLDLKGMVRAIGIPEGRLRFAERYQYMIGQIMDADLAAMYCTADVLLATSMGEGFGIPVVESMSCSTPAIVSNFSAQPEIVGDTGWIVEGQPWWDESHAPSWYFLPGIASIADALEAAYQQRGDQERRARARARVLERYDVDRVYAEQWRPLLAELETLTKPVLPPPANRAERRQAKGRRR